MDAKQQVGKAAAERVTNGMTVGLGTGSTAHHFIVEIARRQREEGLVVQCVSSSFSTSILARDLGLNLLPLEQVEALDIYADGADEVDPRKRLIKGRGAAMVREKILVAMSRQFLAIVDSSKIVPQLGVRFPVPVEVLPFAWRPVQKSLLAMGATQVPVRPATGKDGPIVTDQGNLVLDAYFPASLDVAGLDAPINALPGVVGHGLFCAYTQATTVLIATDHGVEERS